MIRCERENGAELYLPMHVIRRIEKEAEGPLVVTVTRPDGKTGRIPIRSFQMLKATAVYR